MDIIAQADRLKLLDDSLDLPSSAQLFMIMNQINWTQKGDSNVVHQDNASTVTTKSTVLNDSCSTENEKSDACSRAVNNLSTGPCVSGLASSVPDLSILRGEVCLDDLTIRWLEEAFRTTFGRQTTIKSQEQVMAQKTYYNGIDQFLLCSKFRFCS